MPRCPSLHRGGLRIGARTPDASRHCLPFYSLCAQSNVLTCATHARVPPTSRLAGSCKKLSILAALSKNPDCPHVPLPFRMPAKPQHIQSQNHSLPCPADGMPYRGPRFSCSCLSTNFIFAYRHQRFRDSLTPSHAFLAFDAVPHRSREARRGAGRASPGPAGRTQLPPRVQRDDEWSQRMRQQYGLDTSVLTYDPQVRHTVRGDVPVNAPCWPLCSPGISF